MIAVIRYFDRALPRWAGSTNTSPDIAERGAIGNDPRETDLRAVGRVDAEASRAFDAALEQVERHAARPIAVFGDPAMRARKIDPRAVVVDFVAIVADAFHAGTLIVPDRYSLAVPAI
jgi:hypothetical protein